MKQIMASGKHLLPSGSVVVAEVDEIELGIGEIDALRGYVEGESVGPVDLGVDDDRSVGSVHAHPLDSGIFAPVRPEQPTSSANKCVMDNNNVEEPKLAYPGLGSRHIPLGCVMFSFASTTLLVPFSLATEMAFSFESSQ